jgi:hypothetical protein
MNHFLKHRLLLLSFALTMLFHGSLLLNQSFYRTYDALIHIFFASHYQKSWFDPWEPGWYTGFTVFSYPPLSHQLIAALGWIFDLRAAFGVVQFLALWLLVLGVYRFSRLLFSRTAAGLACILLVISSSLTQTVHVFGQLPTVLSLGFLLNATPYLLMYLRFGKRTNLYKTLALLATTTATHHVTTLFGAMFFIVPWVLSHWIASAKLARPLEPTQKPWFYRMLPVSYRAALFFLCMGGLLLVMVLPYWLWSRNDPITQTPIPHASRANYLSNPNAGMMFFLIPWFSGFVFLPYALYLGFRTWRWALSGSLLLLLLLGTGGTTPLPRWILGPAFEILTLERFTFWASILVLPFAGHWLEFALKPNKDSRRRLLMLLVAGLSCLGGVIVISGLTRLRQFQPEPIDIKPIVQFIDKDQHWRYRYLTLGFGDQMAWLSANTNAQTPDGNYHSARRLIELTRTPIERLDGAKYTGVPGLGSLEDFLTHPERFYLKFVFSKDTFYDPLLYFMGWQRVVRLENGVMVWEREDIAPLPERQPRPVIALWQKIMWGGLPFLALGMLPLILLQKASPNRASFGHQWRWGRQILRLLKPDSSRLRLLDSRLHIPVGFKVKTSLVVALLLGVILAVWGLLPTPSTPENTVSAFWNDIDLGRYKQSFVHIEPKSGLTLERYLLERSVRGGLTINYAKLEKIDTKLIVQKPELALVEAHLTWFTSLSTVKEVVQHELVFVDGVWKIHQAPQPTERANLRFDSQASLEYQRPQRRITTDTTATGDILDRPQLELVSARLVSFQNAQGSTMLSVVGELHNIDARPADSTITVRLRDKDNQVLQQDNVGVGMIHKLLPGERTPFRLDFVPPNLEIGSFEVLAKAVVTQIDLERPLAVWVRQPQLESQLQPNQVALFETQISNTSNKNALVSRVFFAFYDQRGLAWLEIQSVPSQITPISSLNQSFRLEPPAAYRVLLRQPRTSDLWIDDQNPQRIETNKIPINFGAYPWVYRLQTQVFLGSP